MVYGNDHEWWWTNHSQGNSQIRGSLAHSKNLDMANISGGTITSFLACEGKGEEIYFQTCKGSVNGTLQ